jgi:hypothetical protein
MVVSKKSSMLKDTQQYQQHIKVSNPLHTNQPVGKPEEGGEAASEETDAERANLGR